MENDMRITYPLWQMGIIAFLIGFIVVLNFTTTFTTFDDGGFEFALSLENGLPYVFLGFNSLFILYVVIFNLKVKQHNRRMPGRKIDLTSWKPQEYMEDDELFQEITKRATKKVYAYFVLVLPALSAIYIVLPISKVWMVSGILLIAMGQYWIYYRTIKKYVAEEDE